MSAHSNSEKLLKVPAGFSCYFVFLFRATGRNREVPRLGVKSELQPQAAATRDLNCVCDLHHSSCQHWILNLLSEVRDQTRILMDPGRVVTAEPQRDLLAAGVTFLFLQARSLSAQCPLPVALIQMEFRTGEKRTQPSTFILTL